MHTRSEWKQICQSHITCLRDGTEHFASYGAAVFSISGANGISLSELGIDAGELGYLMRDNAMALATRHLSMLRRGTNRCFASYIAAIESLSQRYHFTFKEMGTSKDELREIATRHATELAKEHVEAFKSSPAFRITLRHAILELIRRYKVPPASIGFDVTMMAN